MDQGKETIAGAFSALNGTCMGWKVYETIPSLKTKEVVGGKTAREVSEQKRLSHLGGPSKTKNMRNATGPAMQSLMKENAPNDPPAHERITNTRSRQSRQRISRNPSSLDCGEVISYG